MTKGINAEELLAENKSLKVEIQKLLKILECKGSQVCTANIPIQNRFDTLNIDVTNNPNQKDRMEY
jgi:hypothetical protein